MDYSREACEKFKVVQELLYDLFQKKNTQYDNAIEFTGVLGAVVAMTGDIARLRKMILRSQNHGREEASNVQDKLIDIAVQSIIGIMMLQKGNWEGK